MWGEVLSWEEVEFSDQLRGDLQGVPWLGKLLSEIPPRDDLTRADRSRLFELRVAAELHRRKATAAYEYRASDDLSTIDFQVKQPESEWLLEPVSLSSSAAVQDATWIEGIAFGATLSTDAQDPRQSEEGEILLTQQKVLAKVWRDGRPIKCPVLHPGLVNAILIDMRAFGLGHPDEYDFREIAYGVRGLGSRDYLAHWWTNKATGEKERILGLFEAGNPLRGAQVLRERIHFIGFCCESKYALGELPKSIYWVFNPSLFTSEEPAQGILNSGPLRSW